MNCTWRTWTSRVWKNLLFPGFSRVSMGPSTCFLNGFSKKMIWCTWGWAQEANVSYASNMFSNFLGTLSKNSEVFKTKWSNSEEFKPLCIYRYWLVDFLHNRRQVSDFFTRGGKWVWELFVVEIHRIVPGLVPICLFHSKSWIFAGLAGWKYYSYSESPHGDYLDVPGS